MRKVVTNRYAPLTALAAAYCFCVMMFNVPVPDGTTAHAVGAVLVAVLLGPWAAVVAVSVALAIQTLFFGDGGVLAYGANALNMAFVMPFVGYGVYLAIAHRAPLTSRRRAIAAGIGGYVGLNAAAMAAAVEFGIQPVLFHTSDGTPLYAPFHLSQTLPTMALAHLTVAGGVEFALTMGVVAYLQRANLPLLRINHPATSSGATREMPSPRRRWRWRWRWRSAVLVFGVGALLTPIGLLAHGSAFGEGAPSTHSLFNGYGFSHDAHPAVGYIVSALLGMAVIAGVAFAVVSLISRVRSPAR